MKGLPKESVGIASLNKVRTYKATSLDVALRRVSRDLGPNAIILGIQEVKEGFLFFRRKYYIVFAAPPFEIKVPALPVRAPERGRIEEDVVGSILKEMAKLREEIWEIKNIASRDRLPEPVAKLSKHLEEMGIEEGLAVSLAMIVRESLGNNNMGMEKALPILKGWIAKRVSIAPIRLGADRKNPLIVFLIGPTGTGKTTTIGKLAAQFSIVDRERKVLEGNRRVGLVTLDNYRIGGIEQLRKYAEIIGAPFEPVSSFSAFEEALKRLASKGIEIIFVDTIGHSPNNRIRIGEVKGYVEVAKRIFPTEVHLVISVAGHFRDIREIILSYFCGNERIFDKIIFTKLDETRRYGNILNVSLFFKTPVSYITTGQEVPDDIEEANQERLSKLVLGEERM